MFGFFKFGFDGSVFLGEMICIQNIDSYSFRDYSKPFRSAKLGMLPPKLAQIMINLGVGGGSLTSSVGVSVGGAGDGTGAVLGEMILDKKVYDPFCGTGTVLMESMLMGLKASGSDLVEENIEGTIKNIDWLCEKFSVKSSLFAGAFVRDARKITKDDLKDVDCIVTEGFLGVPKQGNESEASLLKELSELGVLYYEFLKAVATQFKVLGSERLTVVFCLPVYKFAKKNFFIENLVEKLPELGYSDLALVPENNLGLKSKPNVLYKRSDQKVFRQVIRLELNAKSQ